MTDEPPSYPEHQKRYEHSEKGRDRKRKYMKRYREQPEIQEREKERDRKEYMRQYYLKRKRLQQEDSSE